MYSDIIQIGNKIDVISPAAKEREKKGGEKAPVLKSQVDDVRSDGTIVIEMPMYKGRVVLVNAGNNYELLFYSKKGLYRALCQVKNRFKEGSLIFATVEPITDLVKFQRREYFRLQCSLDMTGFMIDKEKTSLMNDEELMRYYDTDEVKNTAFKGIMVDISGGGCRFASKSKFETGDLLALSACLQNEKEKLPVLFMMDVISSTKITGSDDTYETRGEFQKLNPKLRERIIKYIFDEDRKMRKKDNGV